MQPADIELVKKLFGLLDAQKLNLSTAESCTGGGIGSWLTSQAGSSVWYLGGYIAYSNTAKVRDLSVPQEALDNYGAVSEQVAGYMAMGAANRTESDLAISVTGIAGPGGGSVEKPVGTVCFGLYFQGQQYTETCQFDGSRQEVQYQSIQHAIQLSINLLDK